MVFAVEEINRNSTLLPEVKLGYRILDSCSRYPWALQGALSLVGGDTHSCDLSASVPRSAAYEQAGEAAGGQPVPLLIGAASSTTGIIMSRILGPLSVPVISYLASCPCLSDRTKFPNFFRTIPSDIYQARAMARMAIRFHWTWMGAVIVFQQEIQGKGVCLEFIETVHRETILTPFTAFSPAPTETALLCCECIFHGYIIFSIWCFQLLQHLNKVNITTPQGERFYFQGADISAKYDLVNWQNTPEGSLKLVLIGQVDGFDIHLNESAIQWSTGSNQVPVSVCSESCPPGTRKANRKGEPLCCFDCIPCAEGEISNKTGSLHCDRCPSEFWSNVEQTACIPRQVDFLSFNETLGITLTTAAVSGVTVTTAVFVVFLYYRKTPVVRANNSELSFLLLLSLKLCFLCSLVFIGRPSVWSCRFQQAAFGISFVLCVSCLLVKTLVVLAVFRSARPGAETLMKWFGPGQQRGSVCLFTCIQVIICAVWLSLSPPVPQRDLGFQGSKVTLECAMASVVGFSLVLGYIGLLACTCLLLAFLARKLPDNFNEAKLITFSMLIFCAVWVAFVPAYVSSPGKYVVAVEVFAILASSYGLLICIFAPKCFIILLRPEKNSKKRLMAR
ncbi:extracellular calcium-sensing receptor-like [Chaetodon auriga]|uniref:extracellular calcium-sensing receptor-like n=1 Tax=Chaetodon auriga TaxID=39042 RepID=UPI00403307C1